MLSFFSSTRLLKYFLGIFIFLTVPIFASAQVDGGAALSLSPASGSYAVGKTFTISVMVDSSQGFNSANAVLAFDPAALSVTNVSKTGSAFSLWAVEPSSDNGKGTISFEGGNTTPLTGKKNLLSVTFKALKEGKSDVSFTSATVLAADGKGTDIAGTKTGGSYDIGAKSADPPPPPPVATPDSGGNASGQKPDEPVVTATTHPNENLYYNSPKAKFTWDLPPDVTVVRLTLDTKPSTTPTTNYDPAISEKEFDQLTDGVMYFHLRYKNDSGWGSIANKKILVDKTPPEPFALTATVDGSSTDVTLKFAATDTLSGIDHYEVSVDGGTPAKVPVSQVLAGVYMLSSQTAGEHKVKVSAFDKAGSTADAEASFVITGLPASAKKALDDSGPPPTDWRLIADIVLIALIAFLCGYLWYERNAFQHEKYIAKREADEVRDNLGNIFAAVREEIGEQVGYLFQKPNPSALDREVMGNINEAIDLSEELLSKEVEDVRKLLM